MAEASRQYMEEQFGETENSTASPAPCSASTSHTRTRSPRSPARPLPVTGGRGSEPVLGGGAGQPGWPLLEDDLSRRGRTLIFLFVVIPPFSFVFSNPTSGAPAFLRENWRFTAILERQGSSGTST